MNLLNTITDLINLDTKTLMGTLVWGNLVMGIIIYLYKSTNKSKIDVRYTIGNMVPIRFLSSFGFLCLFLRGVIPDIISVNIGNSLLFLCYFLESRILLEIANIGGKKLLHFQSASLIFCIVVFNVCDFIFPSSALRIGMASFGIFLLDFPSTLMLLTAKHVSTFKRNTGIFYIPLLIALVPRMIEAFFGNIADLRTINYYQTMLFGSQVLLMISNTIIYLLFLKEKMDNAIEKMANFDHLTEAMNRHSFFRAGKLLFEQQKELKNNVSVLFFDIDFFKKINDFHGHQFGDDVLSRFAATIRKCIRPTDVFCRYGGEEFVVLAVATKEGCMNIAKRILTETEKIAFVAFPDFRMTTSIGCTTGIPKQDETLEMFISRADKAMYKAKDEGRNRVIFSR